jgi:hypothetical protein
VSPRLLEIDVDESLPVGVANDGTPPIKLWIGAPRRTRAGGKRRAGMSSGFKPTAYRTTRSRDYREIDLGTRSPVWAIHASNAANAATIAPITTSIVIASLS